MRDTICKPAIGTVFALVLCILSGSLSAETGPVAIHEKLTKLRLEKYLAYYEDQTGTLDLADILEQDRAGRFAGSESDTLNFGYSDSAYWLKIRTTASGDKKIAWYLEYDYPPMDHIDLYIIHPSGVRVLRTGDRLPFRTRPIPYRTFVFPIEEDGTGSTCFIRIKSEGALVVRLIAWSPEHFERNKDAELPLFWIYYGMMLALGFYNFFIYFSVRESTYLYLVFFILGLSLFTLAHSGLGMQYLWPNAVWWANLCHPIFVFVTIGATLLFTIAFLNTKKHLPRTDTVMRVFCALCFIGVFLPFFAPYRFATRVSVIVATVGGLVMLVVGILSHSKRLRSAKFYLVSWVVFLVGVVLLCFRIFGALPDYFFYNWGYQAGSLVAALFLSLGIADKINIMQSERQAAMEALELSERKYRSIFENATEGIFQVSSNGKLMTANPAIVEIFGYESAQEAIRTIPDLGKQISLNESEYYSIVDLVNEKGVVKNAEIRLVRKDGQIIHGSTNVRAVKDETGKLLYYEGIVQDITQKKIAEEELRKAKDELETHVRERTAELVAANKRLTAEISERTKIEEALRKSEKRYRTILQDIEDVYYEVDLAGNITFCNESAYDVFGYSGDNFFGVNNQEYMDEKNAARVYAAYNRVFQTGEAIRALEYDIIRKDGSKRSIESSVSLMRDIQNRPVGFQGISRDITERKKAEAELTRAKEAAEAANEAKSEFLANMSHEIRTPMNGIIGMCDLVVGTDLTAKQREYLKIIRTSSRSLLGLINDILDFSKIEANKLDFEMIGFSLREVVEEVTDTFIDKICEKELEMVVDIAPETPDHLIGDPLRLRQVLVNLVSNALKFTENGEICIDVRHGKIEDRDVELEFRIRDTGIGIDPGIISKLFDVFTQADGSMTRKYGGTGLGLAICKRIVELMGGRISVESTPGDGSEFTFTAMMKHIPGAEYEIPAPPASVNGKILLVEDNSTLRRILKRHLEYFGFDVFEADSVEAARAVYQQGTAGTRFDLILADLTLPDADEPTIRELELRHLSGEIPPLIVMSPHIDKKHLIRLGDDANVRFMAKPVKPSLLFNAILELLGEKPITEKGGVSPIPTGAFGGVRALLVEDHPINRKVAFEIMTMTGMHVDTANDGLEAVKAVRSKPYDIVFMDVQMPRMDGIEATRIIRKEFSKHRLPIIAMTAHAMESDKRRCMESGMNDYVAKPIDRMRLFAGIRRNLPGRGEETGPETSRIANAWPAPVTNLPGLDISLGMERLGGSWDLYADILKGFCSSQENFIPDFEEAVKTGNFLVARRMAHSVKGAAGNVSAIDLNRSAQALENACVAENESDIYAFLENVKNDFDVIRAAMKQIAPDNTNMRNDELEKPDIDTAGELVEKLVSGLRDADPVASEHALNALKKTGCFKAHELEAAQMEQKIENYCFDEALDVLNRFVSGMEDIER